MGQMGHGDSRVLYFFCGLGGACSMYGGEVMCIQGCGGET